MSRLAVWAPLLALLAACGGHASSTALPAGQVVLYVDTDAPLPSAEQAGTQDPPALFDQLLIDIYAPGSTEPCEGCSRLFEVDSEQVRARAVSFGVLTPPGVTGYAARVRLFRARNASGGDPPAFSTLEVVAALPKVSSEGIVEAAVVLHVDDLGVPRGSLAQPIQASLGKPQHSLVGTWPGAQRVPCSAPPRDGEACVPGGAFWMGNAAGVVAPDGSFDPGVRLVVLDPFYMALHETTVAELRRSGNAVSSAGSALDPVGGSLGIAVDAQPYDFTDPRFFCDYTFEPAKGDLSQEDKAVNCVSWDVARTYCASLSADLPTEAQYEYAAGALRSRAYPWGDDLEGISCDSAVCDRGNLGAFFVSDLWGACRTLGTYGGPAAPGSGARDLVPLEGGAVADLAGNLNEWSLDNWNRLSEPCMQQPLLHNPLCLAQSTDGDMRTVKGGGWFQPPFPVSIRAGADPTLRRAQTGFRCARSN